MNADFIRGFFDELEKIAAGYADMPPATMKTIRPGTKESTDLAAALRKAGVKIPKPSFTERIRGLFFKHRGMKAPLSMKVTSQAAKAPSSIDLSSKGMPSMPSLPELATKSLPGLSGGSSEALSPGEKKELQRQADMRKYKEILKKQGADMDPFMYGLLDELQKVASAAVVGIMDANQPKSKKSLLQKHAVWAAPGQKSLGESLPGKIPAGGVNRILSLAFGPESVKARAGFAKMLKETRKSESPKTGRSLLAVARAHAAGKPGVEGYEGQRMVEAKKTFNRVMGEKKSGPIKGALQRAMTSGSALLKRLRSGRGATT